MKITDLNQYGIDVAFPFKKKYDIYIGGQWVPPVNGEYFENISPITGEAFCPAPHSGPEDIEKALHAAHPVEQQWANIPIAERANLLLRIAKRIDDNRELLAVAESIDNGKALRETRAADIPLAADDVRYFAGCIRAQEGGIC